MIDIVDKNIDAASCCLHVLEAGGRGKKDIILLHGMKFKAATWHELGTLEKLSAAGYHTLALDMPGFGGSAACEKSQDSVLSEFIIQGELDRPILIGPSMGGRIALEFALNHPDIPGGLVLVGAVGVEENTDRLSQLDLPVLLIWGGEDQISPLANSVILLEKIQGAKRIIIEGASHPCYLEQSDTWHTAVLEFIASL
jgi:pimeloyl-ACP methyl ester carboxylesterase